MARRKTDQEKIEDLFFDLAIEEQSDTLRMLEKLYRLKTRQKDAPKLQVVERTGGAA
jgi:hypothetical protein